MVLYQNHRAFLKTNPNFNTNAPPFEVRGCKVILDGLTACTVNYPDMIPKWFNLLAHAGFFIGLNTFIFLLFRYLKKGIRKHMSKFSTKLLVYFPWLLGNILILCFIPKLIRNQSKLV